MPATAAAAFIALILAPGFMMVRGYARRGLHMTPQRDAYAVAEAVVASCVWLALVWLVQHGLGDWIQDWGVLPFDPQRLEDHAGFAVAFGLFVVLMPYVFGVLAARYSDRLHRAPALSGRRSGTARLSRLARRYGFLRKPTAWDLAWTSFQQMGAGEVLVRMKDGSLIRGSWGKHAQVDLSPSPRQLYLQAGYEASEGFDEPTAESSTEAALRQETTYASAGVFIDGSEISAVFFKEKRDEQR